jgi:putative transcriptional regulator
MLSVVMIFNRLAYWRSTKNNGQGVSQAHLARKLHVSRSYVTKLEKGQAQPGAALMLEAARYFQQPVEAIFRLLDEGKNQSNSLWSESIPNSQLTPSLARSAHVSGPSARPSSGHGCKQGQIAGRSGGEGRGEACRVCKPKEKK